MSLKQIKDTLVGAVLIMVALPAVIIVSNFIGGATKLRRDGWAYFVPRWSHFTEAAFYLLLATPFGVGIYLQKTTGNASMWLLTPLIAFAVFSLIPLIKLEVWLEEATGREKVFSAAERRWGGS